MPITVVQLTLSALAAVFAFITAVYGRLNYADGELDRQKKIENRIRNWSRCIEYEREPESSSSVGIELSAEKIFQDDNPEFNFEVDEVFVTEASGWRYLTEKILYGFDGDVTVSIESTRSPMISETPPDFGLITKFEFEKYEMDCHLRPEDNCVEVTIPYADVDRVSYSVDDLLDYIEEELGDELVPRED
ncbi:hypothetical protein [Natronococcus occultus]|nr:hypothetical protein [Natronococcus occultus]